MLGLRGLQNILVPGGPSRSGPSRTTYGVRRAAYRRHLSDTDAGQPRTIARRSLALFSSGATLVLRPRLDFNVRIRTLVLEVLKRWQAWSRRSTLPARAARRWSASRRFAPLRTVSSKATATRRGWATGPSMATSARLRS